MSKACAFCGTTLEDDEIYCPECGANMEEKESVSQSESYYADDDD